LTLSPRKYTIPDTGYGASGSDRNEERRICMNDPNDLVCVTRYCPNCGTEIFCRTEHGKRRVYLSEGMTDPTRDCPECKFNLLSVPFEMLLEDPGLAMERRSLFHKVQTGKHLVEAVFQRRPDLFETKAAAKKAIDAVGTALFDLLSNGEGVRWSGLGSFRIQERKARRGKDPRTGREIRIPAKRVIRFRPAEALTEQLNR
jgi:DNA-binding protein HU-beta